MDITITQIIDYISKFVDYIDKCTPDSLEKNNAISRLEEAVFWMVYLNESKEDINDGE